MESLGMVFLLLLVLWMYPNVEPKDPASQDEGVVEGNQVKIVTKEEFQYFERLPRLEGIQVGHVQRIQLIDGSPPHKVRTISLKPLMFEVPHFLNVRESNALIGMISQQQLGKSEIFQQSIVAQRETRFKDFDDDNDGKLDWREIRLMLMYMRDLHFTKERILELLSAIGGGKAVQDHLVPEEFDAAKIFQHLESLQKENPYISSRYSNQTYLDNTLKAMKALNKRKAALMSLPVEVIQGSETSVAIHYGSTGHYHCHYDSQNDYYGQPCCGRQSLENCKVCRYITMILYLNDVEEGGETAFPLASPDGSAKSIPKDNSEFSNLSEYCHRAALKIAPKRGTAVFWYNHLRNEATGWVGNLDLHSYHGGCDVMRGEKWIINSWVNVIGDKPSDVRTWADPNTPIVGDQPFTEPSHNPVHDEM